MAMSINQFRSAYKFDGARTNLFEVFIINPINPAADQITPLMVHAAALPESAITPIEVYYMGRPIKVAGVRPAFAEWNVTVYNDEDFKIRNAMEEWVNAINSMEGNVRLTGGSSNELYQSVVKVRQLDKIGAVIRSYELVNAWVSAVSPIQLAWDQDAVQNFDLTIQYDYWRPAEGTTGNAGIVINNGGTTS
jgi:hypothetical protein